jgi:transcription elongation factor Elf1
MAASRAAALDLTPFCPRCGTLLVLPDVGSVHCDKCDYSCEMQGEPQKNGDAAAVVVHFFSCGALHSYARPLPA